MRAAEVADAETIGLVQVQVWRQAYVGLMRPERLAAMDPVRIGGLWADRLSDPPAGQRTSVALDGTEVIGFATAGRSRDEEPVAEQELFAINLLERLHGSGAGGDLFDAVVDPGPCSLWVVVGNARAIAFYERRGFVADGATSYDDRLGVTEQRMVRVG